MKRKKVSKKPIKNFLEAAVAIAVALAFIMPGAVVVANQGKCMFTNTIISIVPSTQTVDKGETFTVSVYVEPGEPIMGVSFDYLYFDSDLIHANSVTEGDLFDPYDTFFSGGTIDNVNGEITSVYGFTIPANTVTDPGYFCNISFTAQQNDGISPLDLEDVIIANATGGEAFVTINDGEVIVGEVPNNPPYEPSNPSPSDDATGVSIDADLSWEGGDPDSGDTVTYDIYFGTTSSPPQVVWNQSGTSYDPGTMNYNTQYFWQITAWDDHGASTSGPEWDFTTEEKPNDPPNAPDIDGPTEGQTGTEYDYTFVSTDPDGDDVYYYIDWDDGNVEEWIGPYDSSEEVTVSHTWDEDGDYTIKAKARDIHDAESDWGTLEITMPKNKQSTNTLFLRFLERLTQRFSILEEVLQVTYDKLVNLQ